MRRVIKKIIYFSLEEMNQKTRRMFLLLCVLPAALLSGPGALERSQGEGVTQRRAAGLGRSGGCSPAYALPSLGVTLGKRLDVCRIREHSTHPRALL